MSKRKPESLQNKRKPVPTKMATAIYIFCNGQTERLYFEGLKSSLGLSASHIITIEASERGRLSLAKYVGNRLANEGIKPVEGERQIWLVFDVDSLPKGKQANDPKKIEAQADAAVALCRSLRYKWAVSNECFELWLFLHFNPCESHLHRDVLLKKIKEKIPGYQKTGDIYENYLQGEPTDKAIKNASKLCIPHGDFPERVSLCKPFTNVHKLVEAMKAERLRLNQEDKKHSSQGNRLKIIFPQ